MHRPLEDLFESSLDLASPENTLQQIPPNRGILLITDKNQCPIQILCASNLRRTATAKLSEPKAEEATRKADLRPVASHLYYTQIGSEFHCTWLYNRLVNLLFPEKADELICLPAPHCVCIDPDEAWASFAPSVYPFQDQAALYYGPFPTRKSAELFAQTFNSLFALCRNRPLALGGQGQKCSYYQMGLCPGPCLQNGDQIRYRQTVLKAAQAASDSIEDLEEQLTLQMKTCAGEMQFERAQTIKDQIAQLKKLKGSSYRWTRRLDALKILHITRGSSAVTAENPRRKIPVYCAYLITATKAEKVPNFSFSSIPGFLDTLGHPPGLCRLISKTHSGHLALTSLFLYKSQPPGLWMDLNERQGLDETTLRNIMTAHFHKSAPSSENE